MHSPNNETKPFISNERKIQTLDSIFGFQDFQVFSEEIKLIDSIFDFYEIKNFNEITQNIKNYVTTKDNEIDIAKLVFCTDILSHLAATRVKSASIPFIILSSLLSISIFLYIYINNVLL